MRKYKELDSRIYRTTYRQLRKWAEECPEVEAWMKEHLPAEIFEEVPEIAFKVGQRFLITGSMSEMEYILAKSGDSSAALISLEDGCQWRSPVVVSNYDEITEAEMKQIGGTVFEWRLKK